MRKIIILGVVALTFLACKEIKKEATETVDTIETKKESLKEISSGKPNAEELKKVDTEEPVGMNSAKVELDWVGKYKGVLPCGDCEGIKITIKLKSNGKFKKTEKYLKGKKSSNTVKGDIKWSEDETKIIIEGVTYLVGKEQLVMLDKDGNVVTGGLADKYVLKKK